MGCWQETCAITHSPIFDEESVVMIVRKKEYDPREHGPWLIHDKFIEATEAIHCGTYNDHGWIKEIETPEDQYAIGRIFVLRSIWDQLTNSWDLKAPVPLKECFDRIWRISLLIKMPTSLSEEDAGKLFLLIYFADCVRIDLGVCSKFRGRQAFRENVAAYEKLSLLMTDQAIRLKRIHEGY